MDYRDIITTEARKRGGKPTIRGMRITVYDILEYLASGMTSDEIVADFPILRKMISLRASSLRPTVNAQPWLSSHKKHSERRAAKVSYGNDVS